MQKGLKGAKIAFQTSAILHLLIILDLLEQAWCMGLEILHFDWTGKEIFETILLKGHICYRIPKLDRFLPIVPLATPQS